MISRQSLKLLNHSIYIKKIARKLIIFFIFGLLCIMILPWQQTAFGNGKVIAYSPTERAHFIVSPIEGRLGKWYVQEGSVIKKNDSIVDIYDNDPKILMNLSQELKAIDLRYKTVEQAARVAKINVERQLKLFNSGISSRKSFEQASLEYARYESESANIQSELARIQTRLARQKSQRVFSSGNGTILRRFSGESSVFVKQGDVIAEFVPDTSFLAVELWIDNNDFPLIKRGDIVRLQFEGWPAIQFSGWPSVAVGTFPGVVNIIDVASSVEGKFRILVIPPKSKSWPEKRYLIQGVRAHGWVLLNQVKLGYEIWRRFNGFPPSRNPHDK